MSIYPSWRNEALHIVVYRAKQHVRALLHCPYCGTRNERTAVVCKKCGRKLPSAKNV